MIKPRRHTLLILLIAQGALLGGCKAPVVRNDAGEPEFQISQIAKSDIDMVTDRMVQTNLDDLRRLMIKLYKRNPREWQKTGVGPKARINQLFGHGNANAAMLDVPEMGEARDLEALRLAFRESYEGDRVLAFIYGLKTMIMTSYGDKTDFYLLDDLDPQSLYNSARNIEIAAWKLSTDRDANGNIYMLSNSMDGPVQNLSFERIFGKLIARQEMMSRIVADKTNRTVKSVIQSITQAVFLPI